jgi:hypothetical protein
LVLEKFDADRAQQVPKPPAPTPGVPPGDLPPVPDPAPPPIENPGDAPLSPITDPDVIEPGEPNPARTPMRVRGAVSLRTVRSVISDTSAMNIATPALGPYFGMAPAGTWMWMSLFPNSVASIPKDPARFPASAR